MKLDIAQRGESTEVEVPEGRISVGGDSKDGIRIEGLAAHLLDLTVCGARVTLCPRETLCVNDVLVPRGVPRLLLPGERVALAEDVELRVIAPQPPPLPGTAAVLKQLLSGPADPENTRAASLTCLTGLDMGRRFFIAGDRCVVGRGTDATVRLRDRAVSRQHGRLRKGRTGFYIEDLGSPNGIYVNGSRLRTIRVLNEGDIVEIGRSLLRFTGPAPEPEPALPPPSAPPRDSHGLSATRSRRKNRPGLRADWALIGMGAALALAGLLVTWGLAT